MVGVWIWGCRFRAWSKERGEVTLVEPLVGGIVRGTASPHTKQLAASGEVVALSCGRGGGAGEDLKTVKSFVPFPVSHSFEAKCRWGSGFG